MGHSQAVNPFLESLNCHVCVHLWVARDTGTGQHLQAQPCSHIHPDHGQPGLPRLRRGSGTGGGHEDTHFCSCCPDRSCRRGLCVLVWNCRSGRGLLWGCRETSRCTAAAGTGRRQWLKHNGAAQTHLWGWSRAAPPASRAPGWLQGTRSVLRDPLPWAKALRGLD